MAEQPIAKKWQGKVEAFYKERNMVATPMQDISKSVLKREMLLGQRIGNAVIVEVGVRLDNSANWELTLLFDNFSGYRLVFFPEAVRQITACGGEKEKVDYIKDMIMSYAQQSRKANPWVVEYIKDAKKALDEYPYAGTTGSTGVKLSPPIRVEMNGNDITSFASTVGTTANTRIYSSGTYVTQPPQQDLIAELRAENKKLNEKLNETRYLVDVLTEKLKKLEEVIYHFDNPRGGNGARQL